MRVERVGLEHHRDIAICRAGAGHVLAVDDHAPGLVILEACRDPQQRRLPTSRGANQRDELALSGGKRHVVEHGAGAIGLGNAFEAKSDRLCRIHYHLAFALPEAG